MTGESSRVWWWAQTEQQVQKVAGRVLAPLQNAANSWRGGTPEASTDSKATPPSLRHSPTLSLGLNELCVCLMAGQPFIWRGRRAFFAAIGNASQSQGAF